MRSPRYWAVVALLLLTIAVLYRRGDSDNVPASTPLSEFPQTLDNMTGKDLPIDPEALEILGKGVFLNRVYSPQEQAAGGGDSGPIGLFIGYFPTQRTGQSIHSPQNCLPGAGWTFESSGVTDLTDAGGTTRQVGDYIITNGASRAEVLYWYQSHGRAIANDYKAKMFMLADSIRYRRSDAALVRVVIPLAKGESGDQVHARAAGFASRLIPLLPAYIPN